MSKTKPKILFVSNDKIKAMNMFQEYMDNNSLEILEERAIWSATIKSTTDAEYIITGSIRDEIYLRQADIIYMDDALSKEEIKTVEAGKNSIPVDISDLF